ncbi:MAG TPA: SMI1/KNR4 family protein [Pyrinomonadaceae bacterium]
MRADMTEILDANEKLDESTVFRLEDSLQIKLPPSYRKFLMEFNGGRPVARRFKFKGATRGSSVDRFLGVHNKEHNNLMDYLETYKGRIPPNFFPIAHDPGDNLICISVAGADKGSIYFWDHDREGNDGPPNYSNVILISESFEEFIEGLHEKEASKT